MTGDPSSTITERRRRSRPFANLRCTWWILRTGPMWIELPAIYGHWNSVCPMHLRRAKRGLWPGILQIVARSGMQNGLLSIYATFVKAHQDACQLGGKPEKQAGGSVVLADKASESTSLAVHILEARAFQNILSHETTREPLPDHQELGKLRRVLENFFCRLKRARRVATRYDRLAETFLAFVTLDLSASAFRHSRPAAAVPWPSLRHRPTLADTVFTCAGAGAGFRGGDE